MNDEVKTVLSVIGSTIIVLFITFCIALSSSSFRNKLNDIFDLVPEKQYNQTVDENKTLYEEIEVYSNKLNNLNDEKQLLLNKIAELDITKAEQAQLIENYQQELDELNLKINSLSFQLMNVSRNLDNATVTFVGNRSNINYARYDANNNFMYYTGMGDSGIDVWNQSGQSVIDDLNNVYVSIENDIETSLNHSNFVYLSNQDIYEIVIGNTMHRFEHSSMTYDLDNATNISLHVQLNGVETTLTDAIQNIDRNSNYNYQTNIEYTTHPNSRIVDSLVFNLIINRF